MKITNKFGLPQPIVNAVTQDDYSKGAADISVTGLLSPPRQRALLDKHYAELEEDAADRIWSMIGRIGHGIAERSTEAGAFKELRLFASVLGWRISGQFDHCTVDSGALTDYKFVTVWKAKDSHDDWTAQTNCYAWLLRHSGYPAPTRLQVCAVWRDWSKREAARNADYPQSGATMFDLPLWTDEQTLNFIESRVRLHQAARVALPLCSAAERWEKPATFALMKAGRTRALAVKETEVDILNAAVAKGATELCDGELKPKAGYSIVKRVGEATRCQHYCAVAKWCSQWQEDILNPAHPNNQL